MEVDTDSPEVRLHRACRRADVEGVAELLRAGVCPTHVDPEDGSTPLLEACSAGNPEVVQMLLRASAQVDAVDGEGRSVLLCAAEGGSVELVSWLLEQGFGSLADCAEDGSTPLLCAASSGCVDLIVWLLDESAAADDTLVQPSLDERDARGADALLVAAEAGSTDVLRELLRRGAASDVVDDSGCGLLHYAAAAGHVNVLEFCVRELRMSPASARDNDGDTPLIIASFEGNLDAVRWLLSNGSTLAERNNANQSALMAAAANERADVINFLNGQGGDGGQLWMEDIDMHPGFVLNFIERGL